ncbi:MAG: hypothetical protein WD766_07865 [Gemmatimonadota bacterium]
MRPPRHRFSDEVRSTTRAIASRMKAEGSVTGTPEELDEWIAREPDIRASLERGGYGRVFTSHDLLPLLHARAGTPEEPREGLAPRSRRRRLVATGILVALIVLAMIFTAIG